MNQLSLLIIIGTVAMLLLAMSVVFFVIQYQKRVINHQLEIEKINAQKRKELLQASIQSEEEERMRIASELHDDVGATLASVRLFLHHASSPGSDPEVMNESRELLDESIRKIRNISHKLQPAVLQQLGIRAALEAHAAMISRSQSVCMTANISESLPRLPEQTELSLYRMVQELTNNLIKHAEARTIQLHAAMQANQYILELQHDGLGLDQQLYEQMIFKPGAIGLKNIQSRLESVAGNIQFKEMSNKWWSICIYVNI